MHSTFSQFDICWQSYNIISSSTLHSNLTRKSATTSRIGFKWKFSQPGQNSWNVGVVGKISERCCSPLLPEAGMMKWRCCNGGAGQRRPAGKQLLEPGIAGRSPAASHYRLQPPGKHKRSRQQASISRMTTAPHTLSDYNRQPPLHLPSHTHTHAHTESEEPLPATSPLPLNYQLGWNQFVLFFFHSGGVSQVVGSNLWLVVNSWVLIKARPEFTALQIEVVH